MWTAAVQCGSVPTHDAIAPTKVAAVSIASNVYGFFVHSHMVVAGLAAW